MTNILKRLYPSLKPECRFENEKAKWKQEEAKKLLIEHFGTDELEEWQIIGFLMNVNELHLRISGEPE